MYEPSISLSWEGLINNARALIDRTSEAQSNPGDLGAKSIGFRVFGDAECNLTLEPLPNERRTVDDIGVNLASALATVGLIVAKLEGQTKELRFQLERLRDDQCKLLIGLGETELNFNHTLDELTGELVNLAARIGERTHGNRAKASDNAEASSS